MDITPCNCEQELKEIDRWVELYEVSDDMKYSFLIDALIIMECIHHRHTTSTNSLGTWWTILSMKFLSTSMRKTSRSQMIPKESREMKHMRNNL